MSQLNMSQPNMSRSVVTNRIPESALAEISRWIAQEFGLHYPRERWPHLEREIVSAGVDASFHNPLAYLHKLLARGLNFAEQEALIRRLTVAETYFFREPASLEAFVELAVPKIGAGTRDGTKSQKIWSAGCATGEEPYSIAMLLHKARRFDVEILATDLNAYSLRKAVGAVYTDWSFRGTPPWVKQTHFQRTANNWQLAEPIRKMVTFAHLNLLGEDAAPSADSRALFDVIFCRNVLMYLTPDAIAAVLARFHQSLAPGGWLVVGVTETSQHLFPQFDPIRLGNATLYRKPATATVARCNASTAESIARTFDDRSIGNKIGFPVAANADTPSPHGSHPQASTPNVRPLINQPVRKKLSAQFLPRKTEDVASILTLAREKAGQADLHSALALCEQALRADRMTVAGHYLRALVLQEMELPSEAMRALQQSIYLDPEFVLGHFALGNLTLRAGRRKESRKHFENVLLLLARYRAEDTVPHSEGLSVGRLREVVIGATQQVGSIKARVEQPTATST